MSSKYFYAMIFLISCYMVYLAITFVQGLPKQCPEAGQPIVQPAHSLCVSLDSVKSV